VDEALPVFLGRHLDQIGASRPGPADYVLIEREDWSSHPLFQVMR
jgi:hypothetical protein